MRLLLMGFYTIGIIMTNQRQLYNDMVTKKRTKPMDILRGALMFAREQHDA
ncbi:hypothetical protein F442_01198 [Phytophthora nicotianae P10297]|uniref:PiggyBac transposable element-derived protein domain-containing protein n=1 Tax=Phytophthora nicotianae P10297 TaxID=1317064 RepID=W3A2U0_PHYNI|nr:hypothetical protein F442_01198 [Phytophthora nicotianae P10297]